MRVEMIECDAPSCGSVGKPEGPGLPPYGWWKVEALCLGPGPQVEIEVCSIEDISEAVEARVRQMALDEEEALERSHEDFVKRVLGVKCPSCEAYPGDRCVTGKGSPKQDFHAARRGLVQG